MTLQNLLMRRLRQIIDDVKSGKYGKDENINLLILGQDLAELTDLEDD